MPKLEEILKAKGYTDADLTALAPMLADTKFRGALEGQLSEMETARTKAEKEAEDWAKWHKETAVPTLEKYMNETEAARAEAAAARERIKLAQERGLLAVAGEEDKHVEQTKPKEGEGFDPKKHNLVTMDDATKLAEAAATGIAAIEDLSLEYYELFGKPLSYVGQDGSRGFTALRREAIAAKRPLGEYVADKFKFSDRRTQIAQEQRLAEEARIRKDEREKVIAETVNPMLRAPTSSINPFGNRPSEVAEGKQPWDNASERSQQRVAKALQTVLQQK